MLSLLASAATALVLASTPASAAGVTQIRGVGTFDTTGECNDLASPFYPPIKMVGDLVGCWYTTEVVIDKFTPSGSYSEHGTETFIGCLADTSICGTFSTTYQFHARYAPNGAEMHGHCEHPIASGTGDFATMTGLVNFKDDVQTGEFFYRGHVAFR
jgi:hypothetical protein